MKAEVTILLADDDEGHVGLVRRNFKRAGITNPIVTFPDGSDVLEFLLGEGEGPHYSPSSSYMLLLDIRMPHMDGTEVLRQLRNSSKQFGRLPIVMLTTTDDPREVKKCHELGCNAYVTKPVDYKAFVDVVHKLGLFLSIVEIPNIGQGDE